MTELATMRSEIPRQAECPGECNRNHRARPGAFDPVMGEPVWCDACAQRIADAIAGLPDLAAGLWAIGHDEAGTIWQEVTDRQIEELCQRGVALPVVIHIREVLACGHRVPTVTVRSGNLIPDAARVRPCWQCAIDLPGVDGRLAPVSAAARRSPRILGSPAGSPSYLAVDEVVSWAVSTTDYLKARLPGEHSGIPSSTSANDEARAVALTQCARFLVEWVHHLLATPHARAIGREVLDLQRRAERAAGIDRQPDQPVPVTPCPACDLIALSRSGRDLRVRCRSCGCLVSEAQLAELQEVGS
ncbi:hypothetical protein [Janibacter sp. GS2]|uniref:hypothetical protein n=1 Tax=Janibacter sp. GS2 TaxID=3442646 RepID=UPI003EC13662